MYITPEQLKISLDKLDPVNPFYGISFLAFKQLGLPIGEPSIINIAAQETEILDQFYNPFPSSKFYYSPLRSGGPKERWVLKAKYPTSSLQKLRTTTFIDAFLHPNKNEWAWVPNYVSKLKEKLYNHIKIPAFDLAIWIFRNVEFEDDTNPEDLIEIFFETFNITDRERSELFDETLDNTLFSNQINTFNYSDLPVDYKEIRNLIGVPTDLPPDEGGGLDLIELRNVGTTKHIRLDFGERLNVITGDNGYGKTFILECAWWALSNTWTDPSQPAYPKDVLLPANINYRISGQSKIQSSTTINRSTPTWSATKSERQVLPGLVINCLVDGSYTIWDPIKNYWSVEADKLIGTSTFDSLRLNQKQVWDGYSVDLPSGKSQFICNGIINDWINWQFGGSDNAFPIFKEILELLSP